MTACFVCGTERNADECYSFTLFQPVYACPTHEPEEFRAALDRFLHGDPDYLPLDVVAPYDPDWERQQIAAGRAQRQTDALVPGRGRARSVRFHDPGRDTDDDPTSILDEQNEPAEACPTTMTGGMVPAWVAALERAGAWHVPPIARGGIDYDPNSPTFSGTRPEVDA